MRIVVAMTLLLFGAIGWPQPGRADPWAGPTITAIAPSLAKQDRSRASCEAPCVWERHFGEGGNFMRGDLAYLLAGARPLPDGGAIITGTLFEGQERDVWLTRLDAAGADVWETATPGLACAAAPVGDGSAVLTLDATPGSEYGVLGFDAEGERNFVIGLSFSPFNIDGDGVGGFLVSGRLDREAIVVAYDAAGERRWTWLGGTVDSVALSATRLADGTIFVLGRGPDEDGTNDAIWLATLVGDSGAQTAIAKIHITGGGSMQGCDGVQVLGSIDPLSDGLLVRYSGFDQVAGFMRTTVASIGTDGRMRWLRETPPPADAAPPPSGDDDFSEDGVTAVSPTEDGGALIAGFTHRPRGQGSPYIAALNDVGTEIWRTELPLVEPGDPANPAVFATVEEIADGGVLTAVTDGLQLMRLRGFVFRLGADGGR